MQLPEEQVKIIGAVVNILGVLSKHAYVVSVRHSIFAHHSSLLSRHLSRLLFEGAH